MAAPRWLGVAMLRAMHNEALAAFGGAAGVRDAGLLQSALDRPRNLYAYGDDPSVFDLAAAYCAGIIQNHPFVDGNKRTGVLAAAVFLDLNGYDFRPDEAEAYRIIMALAAGEQDAPELAAWLADNSMRKRG